jgi:uncharacterized protein
VEVGVLFHRRNGGGPRRARSDEPDGVLGVGVLCSPALPAWLQHHLDVVDYVEVTPDLFWTDRGAGSRPRFVELPSPMASLDWLAVRRPLVLHATGLSLGSAGADDSEYRDHLAAWSERYAVRWLSDHLSFTRVRSAAGQVRQAALPLPVSYDAESLDVVCANVAALQARLAVPFLVENAAHHLELAEPEMSEAQFLGALARRTGCGLLLDLQNLCVGARSTAARRAFLDELDLGAVAEIHLAVDGSPVVWELLAQVAARAPRLRGVTLELPEVSWTRLGPDDLRAGLEHARSLWPNAPEG